MAFIPGPALAEQQSDDAPATLSVRLEPAEASPEGTITLKFMVSASGKKVVSYYSPKPGFRVNVAGREGRPILLGEVRRELIPCFVNARCPGVRLEPGEQHSFEATFIPAKDLALDSPGAHELSVRAQVFIADTAMPLPVEKWIETRVALAIVGGEDPVLSCESTDPRLKLALQASPAEAPQEEISLSLSVTNRSDAELQVPADVGCPHTGVPFRLYPVGRAGWPVGPGAPEACPVASKDAFVTLASGASHKITVRLDPPTLGELPAGRYEAVVAYRNSLTS